MNSPDAEKRKGLAIIVVMNALLHPRRIPVLAVLVMSLAMSAGCSRRSNPEGERGPETQRADSQPKQPPNAEPCTIRLRDVTAASGIEFVHTDGATGQKYIVETVSSGLALIDYDQDGLVDIYFPNGAPLPLARADQAGERDGATRAVRKAGQSARHALYRNLGAWRFKGVTDEARVISTAYGLGAVAADYDNDGWPDLYVSHFGPKTLYRNNGDGTFTDVTAQAGVADGNRLGAGACFLDIDGDGWLDLFAGNYVRFSCEANVVPSRGRFREYAGPKSYPPERQGLYRNNGDGTFADVTAASGIGDHPGKGMGVVAADYDDDGDADILLLNDVFGNHCFRNDGKGRFEEVGLLTGFKYSGEGVPLGSMGVDCADYDNDGRLDFFQTSYQDELPVLFHNLGNGALEDVTVRAGAGRATLHNVKWGCGFVDLDNDGRRDLFIAMGHLQDEIEKYDATSSYRARNVVLRNIGTRFVDVSDRCGDGLAPVESSRGAVFDDLDNDGDIDAVVLNARGRPTLIRNLLNEEGTENHWLQVRLQGVKTNRDGVGTRVKVTAGDLVQIDEVHSGRGYQSHWGPRLHFGLGPRARIDRVEIRWLGGGEDVLEDVAADRAISVVEGTGRRGL